MPLHERTQDALKEYYFSGEEDPESQRFQEMLDDLGDLDSQKFREITDDLDDLEHRIRLKSEMAIFMAAIQAEDALTRFGVFNLHKDIAESTEKLAPPEKLLVAAAAAGATEVRGNAVFEGVKRLTAWRNAFAHGHCVDRPTKTLRHNHLIAPAQYPGVPDSIANMRKLVRSYLG